MPRGLPSVVKDELNATQFHAPLYCVRITRVNSEILRWSEQAITFDDGLGTNDYEARLISISGLDFSPDEAGTIDVSIANTDGLITTLDRAHSFSGSQFEIIAYLPNLAQFYILWSGWSDDVTSIDQAQAIFKAYPTVLTPNVQVPKRVMGIPCTNVFANTANWVTTIDFDGSECPYQRMSTIGYFAALPGNIDAVMTDFDIQWAPPGQFNGAKFKRGDVIRMDSELMQITNSPADPDSNGLQSLIVTRAYRQTSPVGHSFSNVYFGNCFYSEADCKRRGMFGNNPTDTYLGGTKKRNYFAGFPFLTGYQYGTYRTKSGERTKPLRLVYSGNDSAYGRSISIVYGRARVADPILLIAKPEGDFLTTLWVVSDGVLATNAADDSQTTPTLAYSHTIDPNGDVVENIYVNGASRHDRSPGMGIQAANGDQDQREPITNFFPTDPAEFITNNLAFWATAWVCMRINTKENPSVDVTGQSITGSMEVQYGKIHRVYTDATNFVRRATSDGLVPGANPAFVLMDLETSKRSGGGLDYSRFNIQSFVDVAAYCDELVPSVFDDGTTVKRWTFNGVVDVRKQLQEWIHFVSLGCYCLPPYMDKDGKLKIRALKAESLTGIPLFSSKIASVTGRNILWEKDRSTLSKSRRPVSEVPNELRVNYIDKSFDPGFNATLVHLIVGSATSFQVHWGSAAIAAGVHFAKDDKIVIDSERIWITQDPGLPDGSGNQTLVVQRGYGGTTAAAHAQGAIVQFVGRSYNKISIVISDRESQTDFGQILSDQSLRTLQKSVDLPGTTTADEAARIGTLILRAGEFGQGGLANNLKVTFQSAYRDAEDLEIGDIIEVEDDLLDAALNERYFRVLRLNQDPIALPDGGFVFAKTIEAVQHDNQIYDDTAFGVSDFTHVDSSSPSDAAPSPVTNFVVAETGIVDVNGVHRAQLLITFDTPDPIGNWSSLIIYRSSDDGAGHPVGDWRFVGEVLTSGSTVTDDATGQLAWFAGVSRSISGHTGDINATDSSGNPIYPRVQLLLDGIADSPLSAPTGLTAIGHGNGIRLSWSAYTGNDALLAKRFNVYRSPLNDTTTAVEIAQTSTNWYEDTDPTIALDISKIFYYWIRGVSWIDALSPFSIVAGANARTYDTVSAYLVQGVQVVGPRLNPIASVTGTAGGTYTGAEQTLINSLVTDVNLILGAMRTHGLIGGPTAFNQPHWPVPPAPLRPPDIRTFIQSTNLSLRGQDTFPYGVGRQTVYDWPNPRIALQPIEHRTFLQSVKLNLIGKDRFIYGVGRQAIYDWPNPLRKRFPIDGLGWTASLLPELRGQDRFFDGPGRPPTYDWPNPRILRSNVNNTWTQVKQH